MIQGTMTENDRHEARVSTIASEFLCSLVSALYETPKLDDLMLEGVRESIEKQASSPIFPETDPVFCLMCYDDIVRISEELDSMCDEIALSAN